MASTSSAVEHVQPYTNPASEATLKGFRFKTCDLEATFDFYVNCLVTCFLWRLQLFFYPISKGFIVEAQRETPTITYLTLTVPNVGTQFTRMPSSFFCSLIVTRLPICASR